MAPWGPVAAVYGTLVAVAAVVRLSGTRRLLLVLGGVAYAVLAAGLSAVEAPLVHLLAPGGLLLAGYWLSGPFFDRPQAGLERWLLDVDARARDALGLRGWTAHAPRWVLEGLEAAYAADYVVIGGGALVLWPLGVQPVVAYWTTVLAAELACYVMLPWVRTRPPRALEPPGALDSRNLAGRRLNIAVLHSASVQANTIPSGHVAGAVASAFAVSAHLPALGMALLVVATLIAVAAVACRYHYLVDVLLGGIVGLTAAWLVLL